MIKNSLSRGSNIVLMGTFYAFSTEDYCRYFYYYYECFGFFEKKERLEFVKDYYNIPGIRDYYGTDEIFNPKFRKFFDFLYSCYCFDDFFKDNTQPDTPSLLAGVREALQTTMEAYTKLCKRKFNYSETHFSIDNSFYQRILEYIRRPIESVHDQEKDDYAFAEWYEEGWSQFAQYPVERKCLLSDAEEEVWNCRPGDLAKDSVEVVVNFPFEKLAYDDISNFYDYGKYLYDLFRDDFICTDKIDSSTVKQLSLLAYGCSSFWSYLYYAVERFPDIALLVNKYLPEDEKGVEKNELYLLLNRQIIQIFRILRRYNVLSNKGIHYLGLDRLSDIVQGFCCSAKEEETKGAITLGLQKEDYDIYNKYTDREIITSHKQSAGFVDYELDFSLLDQILNSPNFSQGKNAISLRETRLTVDHICKKIEEEEKKQALYDVFDILKAANPSGLPCG